MDISQRAVITILLAIDLTPNLANSCPEGRVWLAGVCQLNGSAKVPSRARSKRLHPGTILCYCHNPSVAVGWSNQSKLRRIDHDRSLWRLRPFAEPEECRGDKRLVTALRLFGVKSIASMIFNLETGGNDIKYWIRKASGIRVYRLETSCVITSQ